jgi:hypothetical protein
MKQYLRPLITITLGLLLALLSAALPKSTTPGLEGDFGAAVIFRMQPTVTPPSQDLSEIGSTDGIVTMGILIALIVIIPILLRREAWLENR